MSAEADVIDAEEVEPAAEVVAYEAPPQSVSTLPEAAAFAQLGEVAKVLANSTIIPKAYQGEPANIVAAYLAGRRFGWDVSMSMDSFHIVEGKAALSAEAMLALIRAAGHSVEVDKDEWSTVGVIVSGRRADTGDTEVVQWSLDDAVRAGLCTIVDGAPHARSNYGKPLPWEQYPRAMLAARAIAELARSLFGDVIRGMSYIPEELEAVAHADASVADVDVKALEPDPVTIPGYGPDGDAWLSAKHYYPLLPDEIRAKADKYMADNGYSIDSLPDDGWRKNIADRLVAAAQKYGVEPFEVDKPTEAEPESYPPGHEPFDTPEEAA